MLPVASAATITVGQGKQYTDIQPAIDAASPGDTIEVYNDGVEYMVAGLSVDKQVSIVGIDSASGMPQISLSGGVVTVSADGVTLDRLIISYNSDPTMSSIVINANNVAVTNCIVENSAYGISVSGSNNRIASCTFQFVSNTAIRVESAGNCIIDSIVIDSIEGSTYNGVTITGSSGIAVMGSNLRGDNSGTADGVQGYGIMITGSSDVRIDDCDITRFDIGIDISASSGTSVKNSPIWECYENSVKVDGSPGTVVTGCNFGAYSQYLVYTYGDCAGSVFYQNLFYTSMGSGGILSEGTGIWWNSTAPVSYTYQGNALTGYNGNYWDTYQGYDDDLNGVGDMLYAPYTNVIDYYPLVQTSKQHTFLQFYAPAATIYEGDMQVPIFINRTGDVSTYADFTVDAPGGVAVDGSDYVTTPGLSQGNLQLSFMPGETSKVLYIDALPDTEIESDEWVNFTISGPLTTPQPYVIIGQSQFDLTILDTSQSPSVDIETGNITADEGGPVVPVTIVRSGAANASVYVYFLLSGTAVEGVDFTYEPSSLTFARGESRKTINFTLPGDSIVESGKTIIISLTDITGAMPGARMVTQISIRDTTPIVTPTPSPTPTPTPSPTPTPTPAPVLPAVAFLSPEISGEEGTSAYLVIERSGNVSGPYEAVYTISGGTAKYGVDYTCDPSPGKISFASGDTHAVIRVMLFEDAVAEGPATAVFSLAAENGSSPGSPSTCTLRINDTSNSPAIQFYEPGTVADEGTNITLVIQRVGPANVSADVLLDIEGVTAVYGQDFTCSQSPGRIIFSPGESVKTITISVANDNTAQGHTYAKFLLSDPHGASLGNTSSFVLYIRDLQNADDVPYTVSGGPTTVHVEIPLSEIIPGAIFGFPAVIVCVLTGYMMMRYGGRHKGGRR